MDDRACDQIDLCILLAGGLTQSPLSRQMASAVLDVPIAHERRLLHLWIERIRELVNGEQEPPPVRIAVSHAGPVPKLAGLCQSENIECRHDQVRYRGPAGVVRDIAWTGIDDGVVFIGEASRYIGASLCGMLQAFRAARADILVAQNSDGAPAGAYLIRRGVLRTIPSSGFVDLKEQWLGQLRERGSEVRVWTLPEPGSFTIRDRADVLRAWRHQAVLLDHHRIRTDKRALSSRGPVADSVLGRIHRMRTLPTIIDSVVMPGAVVEPGAIVVRSIVCSGGIVPTGSTIVEQVVMPTGKGRGT